MFDFYLRHEYWFAATQLALAMLGMGATLRLRDFIAVIQQPRALVYGLGIQVVLVPLYAWAVITLMLPTAGVAVGLALVAAIPGGTMSNVFTFLARGHVALSIALTAVTSFLCLVTTPIVLSLLISQHVPGNLDMPAGKIAIEITLILMLPLVLGMVVLELFPGVAARFSKLCIRASIFVILLIIIGASGAGRISLDQFSHRDIMIVLTFIIGLATFSWFAPRWLGLNPADSTAVNIEVTFRNGNLGLLIKASLFPAVVGVLDPIGDKVLFTVLLYGALVFPIAATQVYLHGKRNKATSHR
ncbi:MAG: bile acid:sodium symporter family protein [Halioglobus sp.]|nr:bile acid:sodium symporter family protein [Halioglobus sp.]